MNPIQQDKHNLIRRGFYFLTTRVWAIGLAWVASIVALLTLFWLEDAFKALTNTPVFDTQNALTTSLILKQLPLYQGEALIAYMRFAAFDFVFPLVSALFLVMLCAYLLRRQQHPLLARLWRTKLYLLPLLVMLFDYLENIAFITILSSDGSHTPVGLEAALVFKRLKLTMLFVIQAGTMLLIPCNVFIWIANWRSQANQHT